MQEREAVLDESLRFNYGLRFLKDDSLADDEVQAEVESGVWV